MSRPIIHFLTASLTLAAVCSGVCPASPTSAGAVDGAAPEEATKVIEPVLLNGSLGPLVDPFNADRRRVRFLAILSPTCAACRHGADSIARSLLRDDAPDVAVYIVWAPMLSADDANASREASLLLTDHRVHHFYDPEQRVGRMFRAEIFPHAVEEMRQSLPPDHYMSDILSHRDGSTPEWDIYMFFPEGAVWSPDAVPRPAHWIRQVARFRDEEGSLLSVMWRDSYSHPPIEGELLDQLRELAGGMASAAK